MILSSVYTFIKASDIYFKLYSNFSRDSLNPYTFLPSMTLGYSWTMQKQRLLFFSLTYTILQKKKKKIWLTFIIRNFVPLSIFIKNYIIHVAIHVILWISWFKKKIIPFIMFRFIRSIWFWNSEHFLLISVKKNSECMWRWFSKTLSKTYRDTNISRAQWASE